MPTRKEAIQLLERAGEQDVAKWLRGWRNVDGGSGGWDSRLASLHPRTAAIVWPGGKPHAKKGAVEGDPQRAARGVKPETSAGGAQGAAGDPFDVDALRLRGDVAPVFDAYVVVDWSANTVRKTGADSIWSATLTWTGGTARLETHNWPTRAALIAHLQNELLVPLAKRRVLLGFDFPFGWPAGLAAALGHAGKAGDAWRFVWDRLASEITDDATNANNRFDVAARWNEIVSGGRGPFFGRRNADAHLDDHLTTPQQGVFADPLLSRNGHSLARQRIADARAKTSSSPWFLYGGGNTVGSQALLGVARVAQLRASIPNARVWPFETGAALPSATEARVVFAEVYPSLFHSSKQTLSPSAIPFGANLPKIPQAMSLADIARVRDDFVAAARRAWEAGFEWLELQFAHGYLGQSFFSVHANQRDDPYGGNRENRSRFLLETLVAVRAVWPEHLPLTARFGVLEYDGRDTETLAESIELARAFKRHGLDLLSVSVGFSRPDAVIPWGPAFLAPLAEQIRRAADIPVAAAWGIDNPEIAQNTIASGQLDLVLVGRAHLANPHWPYRNISR